MINVKSMPDHTQECFASDSLSALRLAMNNPDFETRFRKWYGAKYGTEKLAEYIATQEGDQR